MASPPRSTDEFLTLTDVARSTELSEAEVRELHEGGLIEAAAARPELRFDVTVVLRIRKFQRLRRDLEVDPASLGLVLDLLERIDELERRLRALGDARP